MMHPTLQQAVDEAVATFGPDAVSVVERPDGSVRVTVKDLDLGPGWEPSRIELGTVLLTTYPVPAPYPFYLTKGLHRVDGKSVPNLQQVPDQGDTISQLSVRPLGNQAFATLPALLLAVVSWLRSIG